MFNHKSASNTSTIDVGALTRKPFHKRLSAAFRVLVHGERPLQSPPLPLDPRIVAGINHHADFITETYGDPLAGSFARDILTDSAYVIVDSFGVPIEDSVDEAAEVDVTADLLTNTRREPR